MIKTNIYGAVIVMTVTCAVACGPDASIGTTGRGASPSYGTTDPDPGSTCLVDEFIRDCCYVEIGDDLCCEDYLAGHSIDISLRLRHCESISEPPIIGSPPPPLPETYNVYATPGSSCVSTSVDEFPGSIQVGYACERPLTVSPDSSRARGPYSAEIRIEPNLPPSSLPRRFVPAATSGTCILPLAGTALVRECGEPKASLHATRNLADMYAIEQAGATASFSFRIVMVSSSPSLNSRTTDDEFSDNFNPMIGIAGLENGGLRFSRFRSNCGLTSNCDMVLANLGRARRQVAGVELVLTYIDDLGVRAATFRGTSPGTAEIDPGRFHSLPRPTFGGGPTSHSRPISCVEVSIGAGSTKIGAPPPPLYCPYAVSSLCSEERNDVC